MTNQSVRATEATYVERVMEVNTEHLEKAKPSRRVTVLVAASPTYHRRIKRIERGQKKSSSTILCIIMLLRSRLTMG